MPNRKIITLAGGSRLLVGLLFAAPLVFLVGASLRSPAALREQPLAIWQGPWRPANYADALAAMPYFQYQWNTLVYAVGSAVGAVWSCSLAAYAFSRLRWRGRDALFLVLLATLFIPAHITLIPRFLLLRELGLYNSLGALVLPYFLGDAFYIFLLRQFFFTVPEEVCEAARLDGLGELGIWRRMMLPLSRPALVTVALFQFVAAWNDFQGPLLYLRDPEQFPLAYGLERFVSAHSDQTHLLLAAAVLFTLPVAAIFLLAQRYFVEGLATTGLKQ